MDDETKKLAASIEVELAEHEARRRATVIGELLATKDEDRRRLDEQAAAIVVIARTMGIDTNQLPRGLVERSTPPPPAKKPTPPGAQYTRLAVAFAAFEAARQLFELVRFLLQHH